jgi:N-acetylglucosamine-6-phosphate deacetylase
MKIAITAATLLTPFEEIRKPIIIIEDGKIFALGAQDALQLPCGIQTLSFPDAVLAPGFIDLHIHGGAGFDVMQAANSPSALATIEALLAKHGVTAYCPTTVTASIDATKKSLAALGKAIRGKRSADGGAAPIGVHLEGPFISTEKCGVHPTKEIQKPSLELFEEFWQASEATVNVITIAPELPAATELIRDASKRGVRVSVGHSNADSAATLSALAAGASHATHTFNAMRPLDHREPGILGVVLGEERFTADIIADGIHVAPEVIKIFLAAKGEDRAILITDAISATGMPDGRYRLGTFEVDVSNGRATSAERLAGSVLTMDRAVRNIMEIASFSLRQSVRLATINPARMLGIEDRRGSLAVGKDADIVVLTPQGNVIKTIVGGHV